MIINVNNHKKYTIVIAMNTSTKTKKMTFFFTFVRVWAI